MIKFYKYHALGNDYIVINPKECELTLNKEMIKLICDRNYGIGSDGILWGPVEENGNIKLRIFNPDGSEAEKSGNGIRIFSRYIFEKGIVKTANFELVTLGGVVDVEILKKDGSLIKVAMGKVSFASRDIPVDGLDREVINEELELNGERYVATCLTIGNPHCVIPVDKATEELAKQLGPLVENNPLFSNRINMQLLEMIDRANIRIEIWERGAGYTFASGSSSSAAASAAYRLGLVDNCIKVHMPGGEIDIFIDNDMLVHMTGSVNSVCEGVFSEQFYEELMKLASD